MITQQYYVGAYAASPCLNQWDPKLEREFYLGIRDFSLIQGLEHPFYGEGLHRFDEKLFLESINPNWNFVFTCIPGTIGNLKQNPHFGLASDSEEGRKAAVKYTKKALDALHRLNQFLRRKAVVAVQLHSAPSMTKPHVKASVESFQKSLFEITSWNWEGAELIIEHCDAFNSSVPPVKGFMSLEDEMKTILNHSELLGKVSLGLNWGRSAIEGRNTILPLEHIKAVAVQNLLKGYIFSGATAQDENFGQWDDSHAPFLNEEYTKKALLSHSLLSKSELGKSLNLLPLEKLTYLGFKMQFLPGSLSVLERIEGIQSCLDLLDQSMVSKLQLK
ncbi:MAG: DUF4862 family protein [Elusimicrobiota bacterium]